jgi:hypothetical protein
MAGKIFEYAVLHHPKPHKVGDLTVTDPSEIVVDVQRIVAVDEKAVGIRAAREIPEKWLDKLDDLEIAIRPF